MAETRLPGELRRFILEAHPVRGHWVRLIDAWHELRGTRQYPPVVESLLGQAATAVVLLAATLKFDGKLTLQLAGNGLVPLLVAQCTHDFRLRAMAQHAEQLPAEAGFAALIGDGRLVVTIESAQSSQRYQGIVPLEGGSLAACLESYFASSEQLPTRLMLASDRLQASGLLVQKLPASTRGEASGAATQNVWEEVQAGLTALNPTQLLSIDIEALLPTLCGSHDVRLFDLTPVSFECSCNRPRVSELLRSLGEAEARSVLEEQGAVTIGCEFCGRSYRFDAVDVEQLFAARPTRDEPQRLN